MQQLKQSCISQNFLFGSSLIGEETCKTLLSAIIPLGTKLLLLSCDESACVGSKFADVMSTAAVLAGAGDGEGHVTLGQAVIQWVEIW